MNSKDQTKQTIEPISHPNSNLNGINSKQTIEAIAKKYRQSTPNKMYGDELGFLAGYNHAQTEIEQLRRDKEELVKILSIFTDFPNEDFSVEEQNSWYTLSVKVGTMIKAKQLITKHK